MAASTSDSDDEITGINVTPLVDVVLVLLIIFMVTANFIVKETVEVDLPKAAHGGETVQGPINVVLDKQGKLFLDGAEVSEEELVSRIVAIVARQSDTRAVVSADNSLNYGQVIHLVDRVKGAGVAKFALNVQADTAPQPAPAQ